MDSKTDRDDCAFDFEVVRNQGVMFREDCPALHDAPDETFIRDHVRCRCCGTEYFLVTGSCTSAVLDQANEVVVSMTKEEPSVKSSLEFAQRGRLPRADDFVDNFFERDSRWSPDES